METEIMIAVLSLIGTLFGSLAGILTANRLSNYRIGKLEEKVNKHNSLIERTFRIEQNIAILDNRQKGSEHRIEDLEEANK